MSAKATVHVPHNEPTNGSGSRPLTHLALLDHDPGEPSAFLAMNLVEGARSCRGLPRYTAPSACLLDMDGELTELLVATGRAVRDPGWPCFHTRLYRWTYQGREFGVVGGTVGAPFAVLVAEELFAVQCRWLVSLASAGLIASRGTPPMMVLIDRALRDEGTSYHYLNPERYVECDESVVVTVHQAIANNSFEVVRGASWTTDAPFRESETLVASRRDEGIIAVEMEAAALLAMGRHLNKPVACLAYITNVMGKRAEDFDKGSIQLQEQVVELCARALAVGPLTPNAGGQARDP